jgi:hypothetical protein
MGQTSSSTIVAVKVRVFELIPVISEADIMQQRLALVGN